MKNLEESFCFACVETGHTNETRFDPVSGTFVPEICPICNGNRTIPWSRRGMVYQSVPTTIRPRKNPV